MLRNHDFLTEKDDWGPPTTTLQQSLQKVNFVCPPFILYFTSRINKSRAEEISSSHRTPGTKGVMHYFYLAYHNIILSKIPGPLIIVSDLAMWRRAENLNGEWPRKTEIKIAVCRNAETFRKVTMHFIFQSVLAHLICGDPTCIEIVQCNILKHLLQFLLMPISFKSITKIFMNYEIDSFKEIFDLKIPSRSTKH